MRNAFLSLVLMGAAAFAVPQTVSAQEDEPTVSSAAAEEAPASTPQQSGQDLAALRAEVAAQRNSVIQQIAALQAQQDRLDAIERRLALALGEEPVRYAENTSASSPRTAPATTVAAVTPTASNPAGAVGVAPEDADRQPEIAALGRQGSAITKKGKLSGDIEWSYARADRNRALFRGVEVVESVLIGTFDINESRQDILQQKVGLQYGLTDDLEIGIDVPFVARWDTSVLTPVAGPNENGNMREIDNSANGTGIGDVELSLRKQLYAPRGAGPYIIGNLQANLPTGKGPFELSRNEFGEAQDVATGSGFYGLTGGFTAILPSDPGVLFGSIAYTKNFAADVNTAIPPVEILRVNPGDSLSFSAGVGLALNPRFSINFGYAHSWGFGTETTTRALVEDAPEVTSTSRDLQVGRFLFGSTYRIDNRTSVNFGLEAGLTDDATDMRFVLRFPFTL